jgi:hypothetical protein
MDNVRSFFLLGNHGGNKLRPRRVKGPGNYAERPLAAQFGGTKRACSVCCATNYFLSEMKLFQFRVLSLAPLPAWPHADCSDWLQGVGQLKF